MRRFVTHLHGGMMELGLYMILAHPCMWYPHTWWLDDGCMVLLTSHVVTWALKSHMALGCSVWNPFDDIELGNPLWFGTLHPHRWWTFPLDDLVLKPTSLEHMVDLDPWTWWLNEHIMILGMLHPNFFHGCICKVFDTPTLLQPIKFGTNACLWYGMPHSLMTTLIKRGKTTLKRIRRWYGEVIRNWII